MRSQNKRLCIYPKGKPCITGKSYCQSARILQKIRKELKKLENKLISVEEFCQYTSLKLEDVEPIIIWVSVKYKRQQNLNGSILN